MQNLQTSLSGGGPSWKWIPAYARRGWIHHQQISRVYFHFSSSFSGLVLLSLGIFSSKRLRNSSINPHQFRSSIHFRSGETDGENGNNLQQIETYKREHRFIFGLAESTLFMRSIDMCDVTRDRLTFRPLFSYRSIGLFRIEIFLSFFCSGRPFQVRSFYSIQWGGKTICIPGRETGNVFFPKML